MQIEDSIVDVRPGDAIAIPPGLFIRLRTLATGF